MRSSINTPKVKVVFDTNVLFTDDEAKLLSNAAERIIRNAQRETGLDIEWILPSVVVGERRRQMEVRALKLLVPVQKIERLLAHNLALSAETLKHHVSKAIDDCKNELQIVEFEPEYDEIDLRGLVHRAIERKAPFSDDKSEKGFRDAIILEAFSQIVDVAPKTPQSCRVFLVTGDGLLNSAATEKFASQANVTVASSIDEVRTKLTAIGAHMSEEDLAKIIPAAKKYLYDFDKKKGLYERADVLSKVTAEMDLIQHPDSGFTTTLDSIGIAETSFTEKSATQTLTFQTTLVAKMIATKQVFTGAETSAGSNEGLLDYIQGLHSPRPLESKKYLPGTEPEKSSEVERWTTIERKGRAQFSLDWKATMSADTGNLTRGEVLSLSLDNLDWAQD